MDENKTQLNKEKDIKVLRTYTSDMADAIRTNEVSVIKIALAEKEKREQEDMYKEAEGTNASKIFLIIGGIVLIVVAILGSYFLIQKKNESQTTKITIKNIDTFIAYDSFENIDVTNVRDIKGLSTLVNQSAPINSGLVTALFPMVKINNVSTMIPTSTMLSILGVNAPGALTRSLSDKFLLGKYSNQSSVNASNNKIVFLIFQTTDYNQAYASMLEWENNMLKDLFILFNIDIPSSSYLLFNGQFKDIVVNNKDARVMYGENGEAILYYAFVNKNNFVITSNIEALKEVISRLITKNI